MRHFCPRLGIAVAVCLIGSTLQAQVFCARLEALENDAAGLTSTQFDASPLADPVVCSPSLGMGGTVSLHCAWAFEYRAPSAFRLFEGMLDQVEACATALPIDPAFVNHPDSYDLHQFTMGRATVSVSLKDKGALQQTLVFLRVERPSDP